MKRKKALCALLILTACGLFSCSIDDVAIYAVYNESPDTALTEITVDGGKNELQEPILPGDEFAIPVSTGKHTIAIKGIRNGNEARSWSRTISLKNQESYEETIY